MPPTTRRTVADNACSTAPGVLREVLEADVFDVSPVTYPAYEATSLSARSLFPDGKSEIEQKLAEAGTASRRARLDAVIRKARLDTANRQARLNAAKKFSDNPVDLMVDRLRRLTPEAQDALKLIS